MTEAGENAVIGKSVLTVMDISSVRVKISVPESEISAIPGDCKSAITVTALGGREFRGNGIEKSVSANPVSHTYPAHISLANPKRELLPGMVCKVVINPGNAPLEIVIPINIVQSTADGRKYVWSDNAGKAERKYISTGAVKGNGVVVTSGLSAGDRIITEGYQKVSEGSKINVKLP